MKRILSILAVIFAAFSFSSCGGDEKTEEPQAPAMITNVSATAMVEAINLTWDNPSGATFSYVQIEYTDPRDNAKKTAKVNYPGVSWKLENIKKEDGQFTFKLWTVSAEGIAAKSPAQVSATALEEDPVIPVAPPMITGVDAAGTVGGIEITWILPSEGEYAHVVIEYTDPRDSQTKTATVDYPVVTWTLDGIQDTDGEFTFKLWTVSAEGAAAETPVQVSATALEESPVAPPMVSAVSAAGKVGEIEITWTLPAEGAYHHVLIEYTDPRDSQQKSETVNYPATSFTLDDLLQKYGQFTFTLWSVSASGTKSETSATVSATSQKVPAYYGDPVLQKIVFTESMLSQNAADPGEPGATPPKPSESVLGKIIDGDLTSASFYVTSWRGFDPMKNVMPHWVQFDLPEATDNIVMKYWTRWNDYATPAKVEINVGTTGDSWTTLATYTYPGQLPKGSSGGAELFESGELTSAAPFTKVRFNVTETQHGYWATSEIEFWTMVTPLIDPEA